VYFDDREVFRRSRDDPRVFHAIVDRHFDQIHRYLHRRIGRDIADELAAQTFLIAFEKRATWQMAGESARPWLLGIASGLARRHWRSERRRLRAYARTGIDAEAVDDEDELLRHVHTQRRNQELAAALAAMPKRQREALLLYAFGDLSYGEIAAAMSVPVGTVKTWLHRARGTAKRHLTKHDEVHMRGIEGVNTHG